MPTHEGLHEDASAVHPETVDRHRAIASLGEELEAIDWYDQRIDASTDHELRQILAHNRDEEKEHAAMVLEWLRRHDPQLDTALRLYLFTSGNLLEQEEASEHADVEPEDASGGRPGSGGTGRASGGDARARSGDGSLGIGDLRGAEQVNR